MMDDDLIFTFIQCDSDMTVAQYDLLVVDLMHSCEINNLFRCEVSMHNENTLRDHGMTVTVIFNITTLTTE